MSQAAYRGRLAPSPTGLLHLGHARTFLIAAERARHGTLILRNDDLDTQRSHPDFSQAMLEDLNWLGIHWQEGPQINELKIIEHQPDNQPDSNSQTNIGSPQNNETTSSKTIKEIGDYGPYDQSRRASLYTTAFEQLRISGTIYPCTCSRKDLAAAAHAPHAEDDDEPLYPGTCRNRNLLQQLNPHNESATRNNKHHLLHSALTQQETMATQKNEPTAWRFRVPDGEAIHFHDALLGPQSFVAGRDFGDFIVMRRDGVPSYQLACVVDDTAMRITEVVRGRDLLRSTARQILLLRALNLPQPAYAHCELVRNQHGERLAKRDATRSLRHLRASGYTPQQVRQIALDSMNIPTSRN